MSVSSVSEEAEGEVNFGLGILEGGESTDPQNLSPNSKQEQRDRIVDRELAGVTTVEIAGVVCRTITMTDMALLQEINSVFVRFVPYLTPLERTHYKEWGEKLERGGKLKPADHKKFMALHEKMIKENEQVDNPYMECLMFLNLMRVDLELEEAAALVYGTGTIGQLRMGALALGRDITVEDWSKVGEEIMANVHEHAEAKVTPKPEKRHRKRVNVGKSSSPPTPSD